MQLLFKGLQIYDLQTGFVKFFGVKFWNCGNLGQPKGFFVGDFNEFDWNLKESSFFTFFISTHKIFGFKKIHLEYWFFINSNI